MLVKLKIVAFIVLLYKISPQEWKDFLRSQAVFILLKLVQLIEVKLPKKIIRPKTAAAIKQNSLTSLPLTQSPVESSTQSKHPYSSTIAAAFITIKSLESSLEWTSISKTSDIEISNLITDGCVLPFIRGVSTFTTNYTLQEILSVIRSGTARQTWDPRFDTSKTLDYLSLTDSLVYSVQKGTFPVAPRDFVVASSIIHESSTKIYFLTVSVMDSKVPEVSGKVRAELVVGGWVLEQVDGKVMVSYMVGVDIKGYVPSSIVRAVQTQTPLCVMNVMKYVESTGIMPFVVNQPGLKADKDNIKLTKFDYDNLKGCFSVNYKYLNPMEKEKAKLTICLPVAKFKGGFDIRASPTHCLPRLVKIYVDGINSEHGILVCFESVSDTPLVISVEVVANKSTMFTMNGVTMTTC